MERRGGSWIVGSALGGVLSAVGTPSLALAEPAGQGAAGAGLTAELFGLLAFVVLAVAAHYRARRSRH